MWKKDDHMIWDELTRQEQEWLAKSLSAEADAELHYAGELEEESKIGPYIARNDKTSMANHFRGLATAKHNLAARILCGDWQRVK